MKKIYLFSDVCDNFIENEIPYLSEYFDSVIIVPFWSISFNKKFVLPSNCELLLPVCKSKIAFVANSFFVWNTLPGFLKEFFSNRLWLNKNRLKRFLISCLTINYYCNSSVVRTIVRNVSDEDIFYSYWGMGAAEWFPFVKYLNVKKIVRFHRGDLYEEYNYGYLPFRKRIFISIDLAVFISLNGKQYLNNKYIELKNKSIFSRMGNFDHGLALQRGKREILHLQSCSYVHSIKRVHLIFEALQCEHVRVIKWTHIGGGEDFEDLKHLVKQANSNLQISLLGDLSNEEVYEFYKTNYVTAFLNVSSSEGVPVSIMEAISFNIPVVATNVGGTSEIVTDETGILLSSDPTAEEILNALYSIESINVQPREFWKQKYNADTNYKEFVKVLNSL